MKIVRLEADNVKRLVAVEIEPDGNIVPISGRNGAGKTSVLDAIEYALGGGGATRGVRVIRDGEHRAQVRLELGDGEHIEYVVTRTWAGERAPSLRVESGDGKRLTSPQQVLDAIVGRLAFDPLAFMGMPDKEQLATLLGLVTLPFDPAALDAAKTAAFESRTEVGRTVRQLEGELAGLPEPDPDTPDEEESAAELLAQYQAGTAAWDAYNTARQTAVDATARVERLRQELFEAEVALRSAESAVPDRDGLPDVDELSDRLAAVTDTNERVRAKRHRADVEVRLAAAREEQDAFTAEIERIDATRAEGLRAAKMPVEGLGFTADGVTYGGVPIKQASTAEQIRASVAIAAAVNPDLRVMLVREGSLLDSGNLGLLARMADELDVQVWLEVVNDGGGLGFVIEEGMVAEAPEPVGGEGRG